MIFLKRYWETQSKDTIHVSHLVLQCLGNGCANHQGKIKTRSIYSKRKKNKIQINSPPEVHGGSWNIVFNTHIKKVFTFLSYRSPCFMCYNYSSIKKQLSWQKLSASRGGAERNQFWIHLIAWIYIQNRGSINIKPLTSGHTMNIPLSSYIKLILTLVVFEHCIYSHREQR